MDPYSEIYSSDFPGVVGGKILVQVRWYVKFSGGYSGGATSLPIPNRAVKPSCADGTARDTWWESRTLPGFIKKAHSFINMDGAFFFYWGKLEILRVKCISFSVFSRFGCFSTISK